jgi:hypothetical protein
VYFRPGHIDVGAILGSVSCGNHPRRDLRSVLKMAVPGQRCGTPGKENLAPTSKAGQEVVQVRLGVVLNTGLRGVQTNGGFLRLPRVKTLFGGNMWVIRNLMTAEVLSCWEDVPEKLGMIAQSDEKKRILMNTMFTPIKIRQAVLEDLAPVISELLSMPKEEEGSSARTVNEEFACKRGPKLKIMSAEEERAIFEDVSEPPVNTLIHHD